MHTEAHTKAQLNSHIIVPKHVELYAIAAVAFKFLIKFSVKNAYFIPWYVYNAYVLYI